MQKSLEPNSKKNNRINHVQNLLRYLRANSDIEKTSKFCAPPPPPICIYQKTRNRNFPDTPFAHFKPYRLYPVQPSHFFLKITAGAVLANLLGFPQNCHELLFKFSRQNFKKLSGLFEVKLKIEIYLAVVKFESHIKDVDLDGHFSRQLWNIRF